MTTPTADWDKIGRYLAGEASPADAAEVERWFSDNPAEARAFRTIDASARTVDLGRPLDVERALARVKTQTPQRRSPERLVRFTKRIEWIAAAAAIILVAGVFLFRRVETSRLVPTGEVGYATSVGQRDSVRLDDGSVVVLGPSSRISVRGREVQLTGDAYFRVNHDDRRPFLVHAGSAVVRDIGTAFTVQSDRAQAVRVVVTDGVVALSHRADSVRLQQGDVGVVGADGRVTASRGAATPDDVAWVQGRLVFRDAALGQVGSDLRRWYGVELRVTDSLLLQRVFTGSFATEPVDRVLETIRLALGVRIERRGDTAFVSPTAIK